MPDPWSLRILVAVAERGSFSAAAEALALSQPAVSRQMGGLERHFGVALFHRVARGVTPTPAGATAVDLAREALGRLDAIDATMKGFAGLGTGELRIAAFASANTSFVPEAIRRFGAAHPGVAITLLQADDVVGDVRSGRLDIALVTAWQLTEADEPVELDPGYTGPAAAAGREGRHDGVDLVPLLDELAVALPAGHPLAGRRTVRLRDLRHEAWVEGAHPDCLGPLAQLAEALGGPPRIAFTCDDWNGKQALVAGGAGVMLVPTLARAAMRTGIRLRPTSPRLPARRLYAAVPRPPFRSPAADAMLTLLTEALRDGHAAVPPHTAAL